jgi:SEC-C motif-containing protein
VSDGAACPCGSTVALAACCGRFLAGTPAPTALELMRSRYTAYARGAIDYLIETHDPDTRAAMDVAAATAWSRDTAWAGLEIVTTTGGGPDDDVGVVEFIARGATRGVAFAHRERSRFRRVDGRWVYVDGATPPATAAPRPGRNEPCPCGSGRKYKRCHGA